VFRFSAASWCSIWLPLLGLIAAATMALPLYFLFASRDLSRHWYRSAEQILES
jgi:hypothetical protein